VLNLLALTGMASLLCGTMKLTYLEDLLQSILTDLMKLQDTTPNLLGLIPTQLVAALSNTTTVDGTGTIWFATMDLLVTLLDSPCTQLDHHHARRAANTHIFV